jgi:hypothetical protein
VVFDHFGLTSSIWVIGSQQVRTKAARLVPRMVANN